MPGTASLTVTGTQGPGLTVTSGVYSNIRSFKFDAVTAMLELMDVSDKFTQISIAAATTVTVTLSAAFGNYTVVVS